MENSLFPIINEASLKADMIEGLASCLKVDNTTAAKYITEEEIERCVSSMLDTENEIILAIVKEIKEEKYNV